MFSIFWKCLCCYKLQWLSNPDWFSYIYFIGMGIFHLQKGKHYLSYNTWPLLEGSYKQQERKMSALFARVLGFLLVFRSPWAFSVPVLLLPWWQRQLCGLSSGTGHTVGCTLCLSLCRTLCSVVCTDSSHPTVWGKVLDWSCVHISEILLNSA